MKPRRYSDPRIEPARPDLAADWLRGEVEAARYVQGTPHVVIAGAAALRGERTSCAAPLTELLFGECFLVYETRGGWLWGQSLRDAYVGYVDRKALRPGANMPTHMVSALFAHLKAEPALKTAARALLPMASLLTPGETSACGGYARVEETGDWISLRHVVPLDRPGDDAVAVAERLLGVPYLWGGRTPAGLDCSALVQIAFAMTGLALPRDSDLQLEAFRTRIAEPVAPGEAARGDVAFFPAHVGIMVDGERLLHANATQMAVSVDPLETVIARVARDHEAPFSGLFRPRNIPKADIRSPSFETDGAG